MIPVKSLTYNDINLSIKKKLQTHDVKKRKNSYTSLEDDPLFLTAAIIELVHKAS
jgi:hypothetical protein